MSTSADMETAVRQLGGDPADLPFWNACKQGRFLLHRCARCSRTYWPASHCTEHGNAAMAWIDGSGKGELYTYTVMHHAYTPTMKDKVPYVVAVIKLDEGPFFHSNLLGCPLDELAVGMRVSAEMIEHESGLTIPVFRRAI